MIGKYNHPSRKVAKSSKTDVIRTKCNETIKKHMAFLCFYGRKTKDKF